MSFIPIRLKIGWWSSLACAAFAVSPCGVAWADTTEATETVSSQEPVDATPVMVQRVTDAPATLRETTATSDRFTPMSSSGGTLVAENSSGSTPAANAPTEPPPVPVATNSTGGALSQTSMPGPEDWIIGQNRLPIQLGITATAYYDDNIYAAPKGGPKTSDLIWSITPEIGWNSASETGADNSVQFAYAPSFVFYQDHSQNNTIDQSGQFSYAYHGAKDDLIISEAAASVQDTNADYGGLVKDTSFITEVNFTHTFSAKTSLNVVARNMIVDYDPGYDSTEWTGEAYLDYQTLEKISLGVGGLVGFADLDGPNQTFQQANLRVDYTPSEKLQFTATLGAEFRQTEGNNSNTVTPDFSLSGTWEPQEGSNLTLNAYRHYDYSGKFFGEDYLATGFGVSYSQRLLNRFYLVLGASFEDAQYDSNLTSESTGQSYDYVSLRPALIYKPTEWCKLTVFYNYRRNISDSLSDFTDNQVGIEARFTY